MEATVNLNTEVRVKLTFEGVEYIRMILQKDLDKQNTENNKPLEPLGGMLLKMLKPQEDGYWYYSFSLFMSIFNEGIQKITYDDTHLFVDDEITFVSETFAEKQNRVRRQVEARR